MAAKATAAVRPAASASILETFSLNGYSPFCELYERWGRQQDVVLRQEHRAGEKMFVDWVGDTIPIYHRHGAEVRSASLSPFWVPVPTPLLRPSYIGYRKSW